MCLPVCDEKGRYLLNNFGWQLTSFYSPSTSQWKNKVSLIPDNTLWSHFQVFKCFLILDLFLAIDFLILLNFLILFNNFPDLWKKTDRKNSKRNLRLFGFEIPGLRKNQLCKSFCSQQGHYFWIAWLPKQDLGFASHKNKTLKTKRSRISVNMTYSPITG